MIELSIVIAAYNEEKRLPVTLGKILNDMVALGVSYEILVVDDGSIDRTAALVQKFTDIHPEVRIISHAPNRGRGFSIRRGVFASRGEIILETDADGSVDNEAIPRFLSFFREHPDIDVCIGSRRLPDAEILGSQPFLRLILGYGFLLLAKLLLGPWRTTDFTLGFKMFRRKAAEDIFSHQYDNQYVAEAEILFAAYRRRWRIQELPVVWSVNRDSRVRPMRDAARSLRGVFSILRRRGAGTYGE
jgi:dolichyl-phosphate beta-glucosyltransferase